MSAKTIKNKVAAPFRDCKFEIHFGVGIKEHEQIFDVLRKHGKEVIDGDEVSVSGSGTWKSFIVSDVNTGEVKIEKKFYKTEFVRSSICTLSRRPLREIDGEEDGRSV